MYISEILTLLSWPVLVVISYYVTAKLIKNFESREEINKQN